MPPANPTLTKWPKTHTADHLHRLVHAECDLRRALALFDVATAASVSEPAPIFLSLGTVSLLTSCLASVSLLPLTASLLSCLHTLFPSPTTLEPPFLALLHAFSRTHRPITSLHLFHSVPFALAIAHSARSYTVVLAAIVAAANCLDKMVSAGIGPNWVTWRLHVRINDAVVTALSAFMSG